LQYSFQNDKVRYEIDGQEVFNEDSISTQAVLGVAAINPFKYAEGSHKIKVIVNDVDVHEESFTLKKDTYIGVRYNRTSREITLKFSDESYMYE
jgi:hypothetical protein